MKMRNSCLEVAVQKAYKLFADGDLEFDTDRSINDNQVVIGSVITALNEGMRFLGMDVPDCIDLDYSKESGASAELLAAALRKLNKDSTYILRSGRAYESGHFHTVYFDPEHGWILYSSSKGIFQLTDQDDRVVELPHREVRAADQVVHVEGYPERLVIEGEVLARYPSWMEPLDIDGGVVYETKDILGGGELIVTDRAWGTNFGQQYFDFTPLTKERTIGCANFLAQYRTQIPNDLSQAEQDKMENSIASSIAFSERDGFQEIDTETGYWHGPDLIEKDGIVEKNTGITLHYRCSQNADKVELMEIIDSDPDSTIRQHPTNGKTPFDFLLDNAKQHHRSFDEIKPKVDLILSDLILKGQEYASEAYDKLCAANLTAFEQVSKEEYFASLQKMVVQAGVDEDDDGDEEELEDEDEDEDEVFDLVQQQKDRVIEHYNGVLNQSIRDNIDKKVALFLAASNDNAEYYAIEGETKHRFETKNIKVYEALTSYCFACLPPDTSEEKIQSMTALLRKYPNNIGPYVDKALDSRARDFWWDKEEEEDEEEALPGVDELTIYYKENFAPLMTAGTGLEKDYLSTVLAELIAKCEELKSLHPGEPLNRTLQALLQKTLEDQDTTVDLKSLVDKARVSGKLTTVDEEEQEDEQDDEQDDVDVVNKHAAVAALNKALDEYLVNRQEDLDPPREKYFWGEIFGGGEKLYTKTRCSSRIESCIGL